MARKGQKVYYIGIDDDGIGIVEGKITNVDDWFHMASKPRIGRHTYRVYYWVIAKKAHFNSSASRKLKSKRFGLGWTPFSLGHAESLGDHYYLRLNEAKIALSEAIRHRNEYWLIKKKK